MKYRYLILPFHTAPGGDIFERKIDKIFNELHNVFGASVDILVVGYNKDNTDHGDTLERILKVCRKENYI